MSSIVAEIQELRSEHAGAICEEIGERLACILRPTGSGSAAEARGINV